MVTVSEVIYYRFLRMLFVRSGSLSSAHTQGVGNRLNLPKVGVLKIYEHILKPPQEEQEYICPLFTFTVRCHLRRYRNDTEEVGYKPDMFKGEKKELQQNGVLAGGVSVRCRDAWSRSLGNGAKGRQWASIGGI